MIDECDSLDTKINSRKVAREKRIPVIMDTSDRGMIDIERFDLEPKRPLFHGRINETNITSNRLELIKQIIDFPNCTERLQKSFNEVGKTLSSWPQLASSVTQGGGITTSVVRNILLYGKPLSGRYYNDDL